MSEAMRNKKILAQAYRRWHESLGGSVDHWMDILEDDIAFGSLAEGSAPTTFTARMRGKQEVKTYFEGLLGAWTMIYYTVDYFVAEGDRIVAIGSTAWRNKATNKKFESPKVDVWRLRNGRAIEFYEYYDTANLITAGS